MPRTRSQSTDEPSSIIDSIDDQQLASLLLHALNKNVPPNTVVPETDLPVHAVHVTDPLTPDDTAGDRVSPRSKQLAATQAAAQAAYDEDKQYDEIEQTAGFECLRNDVGHTTFDKGDYRIVFNDDGAWHVGDVAEAHAAWADAIWTYETAVSPVAPGKNH